MTEKVRKPRSDSKMYQLPKDVLDQVNNMLLNENMKYSDIQYWLETEHNMKISLSSISNYAVKIYQAAQRISDDLERTKFFVDYIGDKSELDASKATTAILKSGLLQKIATAEEEFNEMPVEKAGRLLVELNRSEIARERLELDYKKKTELAFEELETRMYKLIKGYPELREKLVEVLKEAKQKWLEQQEELK
ncbi:DUF3486 family protein [Blautia obeum]|uniref:phage protein Gp27 family protein n=1 Tax=Blautia obeum TaxID=40520 RepID=UPI000E4E033F|nr:phage protein Gp27 family protein [Blautia obeum]RHB46891.1 DUF3486 family protein [Blautia obeum]